MKIGFWSACMTVSLCAAGSAIDRLIPGKNKFINGR
ncbi:hypothetical protein X747_03125 [Mesorhizobium sp. LNJC384A00]|nr:hypothetical protein X747_03125 [Mesorhizobium sp. LNJC384A00]ESY50669.1 hypothetical protein X746_00345 [Mesorhizobium sp. LNJC380A00]ESZ42968.1 hypothetical protein X732_03825 [Mesorhizobium sp. L2C066B000]ESZ46908.1 hypothetical protein X731_14620 [Mesorhizobium sp. L2C054A000]